jgi:hypothetical protein
VEISSTKNLATSASNFHKAAQRKQSPISRKFVQSGRPAATLVLSQSLVSEDWNRCCDFKNIFGKKIGEKIAVLSFCWQKLDRNIVFFF